MWGKNIKNQEEYNLLNPLIFANGVLEYSFKEKKYLTVNVLNALVYLSTVELMKARESCEPVFAENFQVYKYGAVLKSVHDYFSGFNGKIKKYIVTNYRQEHKEVYNSKEIQVAISSTWIKYSDRDFKTLAEKIRKPHGAWDYSFQHNQRFLSWENMLTSA